MKTIMKNWTLPEPKPKCNNQPSFNTIKHNKYQNDARRYKNFNWINNRLIIVGIKFEADAESRNYQKIYYRWHLSKIIICSITKYKVTIINYCSSCSRGWLLCQLAVLVTGTLIFLPHANSHNIFEHLFPHLRWKPGQMDNWIRPRSSPVDCYV